MAVEQVDPQGDKREEQKEEQAPESDSKLDPEPWLEPKVPTLAIFTELFTAGERTEAQLEQILNRYSTTMGWTDFWARQGYIAEVVKGSERHFILSGTAVLVLELP